MEAETIIAVARSDVEVVGENMEEARIIMEADSNRVAMVEVDRKVVMEEARITMEADSNRVAMVEVDRKVVMEEADRKVATEEADSKAIRGGMVEEVSLPRHCPSSPKIIHIGHLLTLIR
jgi:hypothetical protein